MNDLILSFKKSVLDSSVSEIGKEYLELRVDEILDYDLLKDIPIVGTISALIKTVANIRERNLLKQTLHFINEFNQYGVSSERIRQYRDKLQENPKKMEDEFGRVLILLDRNVDINKSKLEARFFAAYINDDIKWGTFCEFCEITERLFLADIEVLKSTYQNNGVTTETGTNYRHDRLVSIGLLTNGNFTMGNVFLRVDGDNNPVKLKELTEVGNLFCKIAFE